MANIIDSELGVTLREWRIWSYLAAEDIRLRYRRSVIGPWWITISMVITITCLGFLYGKIFHSPIDVYLPYLASGILCWSFMTTLLLEASHVFIDAGGFIQNQEVCFSTCVMQLIYRNLIIFFHNILVFVPIVLYFQLPVSVKILGLIPGLVIISINGLFYGTFLAVIGTRFRDLSQIVNSLVQVAFFFTPIMWMPSVLSSEYLKLVAYNPFYHCLNLLRLPLLNQTIDVQDMVSVSLVTGFGFLIYAYCLRNYRHRIVFWL